MTKKDYEKFAELIAVGKAYNWDTEAVFCAIGNLFTSENPNFNLDKFEKAINLEVSRIRIGSGNVTR